MPKMVNFGEFLRSNSVTRQVTFNLTKISAKCQNSNATFSLIFKLCGHVKTSSRILPSTVTESFAFLHALKKSHGFVKEKINLEKDVKALWNFLCQISSLKSNQLFYLLAIVFDSLLPGLLRERF